MKNVLWLTSWYPNRMDNFDGDFIQRHARAVAGFCKVQVIHVVKCKNNPGVEEKITGNLSEKIIYYKSIKTGIELLDRFISHYTYKKEYRKVITDYMNTNVNPVCVHVHVTIKAGLLALWIKKKWNIPFIVTEHWTAWLPEADIRIDSFPALYQKWLKKIIENSRELTVVSEHLGKAMHKKFPLVKYRVVPNVADTSIFFPVQKQENEVFQLIHASGMNYQKNTEDILQALQILNQQNTAFKMDLYGPINPSIQEKIRALGLQEKVFSKGEVPQNQLAKAMQQADLLILYSRFETFGCVIIEANACGVPVIVSDLEVFHELVEDQVNGLFAEKGNPSSLADKIALLLSKKEMFNSSRIAEKNAEKYSFANVGRQFDEIYGLVCNIKPGATSKHGI